MRDNFDYDLFVIGAGSAGVRTARMVAETGKKVAIAEEFRSGGACVIRGCVPKKLYAYASRFRDDFHIARSFGFEAPVIDFNWNILRDNKEKEITRLEHIYETRLKDAGVTLFKSRAVLEGKHEIRLLAEDKIVTAKNIVIAVGGVPRPLHHNGHSIGMTSDEIFDLPALPDKIFIYGGGYIGVEFASIFHGLGVDVTIGYRGDKILGGFDNDIRHCLIEEYLGKGITLIPFFTKEKMTIQSGGVLSFTHDGKTQEFKHILNASGRIPKTQDLGLEKAGIETDKNGTIIVDKYSKTTADSVYAVGDVTNRLTLTPVAIEEAMCLVQTLCYDNPTAPDYENVPTAIFTTPEIGSVGLSEDKAIAAGYAIDIYESRFRTMKYSLSDKTTKNYMKMIVDKKTNIVLGVHIFGNDSAEIIQCIGIAIKAKLTKEHFDATMAVHPSIAEELVTMRTPSRTVEN